jgi:23S rRNA pseudouridine1911/1915/1917 synthase
MTFPLESLIVTPEMVKIRLDKLLKETFPGHSRAYFQYLIETGLVLVNGMSVKKRETLSVGDEIEICFELTPELKAEPEQIPLDILYEDEYLLAINKPAGMVTHPAPGHFSGTFANALLYHCKQIESKDSIRPGIVHRLDKDTSGVLIAAKTSHIHQQLVELFTSRKVTKHYVALCLQNPGDRTIEVPIKRHPVKRQQMCVDPTGKPAISICKVIKKIDKLTWVDVQLVTGRTHQIRVHLKHIGAPILGDAVYGSPSVNSQYKAHRQMLHAYRMRLPHPVSGKELLIQAPLPSEWKPFEPPEWL